MLKAEEAERTRRLREILDRIAAAEQRASAAEERARAAVDRVSEPFEPLGPGELHEPAPALEPEPVMEPEPVGGGRGPVSRARRSRGIRPGDGVRGAALDQHGELRGAPGARASVTQTGRVLARRERAGPFSASTSST